MATVIKRYKLDPNNSPRLAVSDLRRLDGMTDADIDYSDIPEFDDVSLRTPPW